MSRYEIVEKGTLYTRSYRLYFKESNTQSFISPFHDIPLFADFSSKLYNMIVEIPRWTNAKMEINTKEPLNPIMQDIKKDKPRFVNSFFPHHGYIWNYGAFPQTWEDPSYIDPNTQKGGDNDPIDVIEIGEQVANRGDVLQVKVLGLFGLIDEGETDWKVIVISNSDPLFSSISTLQDIETHKPGYLQASYEWLKFYKVPSEKPVNNFAFEGKPMNAIMACSIIEQAHCHWKKLVNSSEINQILSTLNTKVEDSPNLKSVGEASKILDCVPVSTLPDPIPSSTNKWCFFKDLNSALLFTFLVLCLAHF